MMPSSHSRLKSPPILIYMTKGTFNSSTSFIDLCIRLAILLTLLNQASLVSSSETNSPVTLEHVTKITSQRLAKLKRFALYYPARLQPEKCSTTKFITLGLETYGNC